MLVSEKHIFRALKKKVLRYVKQSKGGLKDII
jgi:hypothetical protein